MVYSWALATVYQTLLITRQHLQGEKQEIRPTAAVATQTAAELQEQPMPIEQEEEAGTEIITSPYPWVSCRV